MMTIRKGIDISAHQGDIDLRALKTQSQIDFVIIRVGYGTQGTIDKKFKRNADLCKELDIPMGFYWYSYALDVEGAKKEADAFLSAIAPYNPTMGCWFDMEDADGYKAKHGMPDDETLQDMCYEFCKKVDEAGYYAGVYASRYWFETKLNNQKLSEFDKWVAQWPTAFGKQKGNSVDPNSRNDLSMWQYTSEGKLAGYNGYLDMNYAYSDFTNPSETITPEPEPPMVTPEGTVLELAVRTQKGEFGDGEERKSRLNTRYEEVQIFINHIYEASVDTLASEVMKNKYGTGETRKIVLGERYNEVQEKVNQLLNNMSKIIKGTKIRFTGTKSYSGIKLADWTHNDIFNVIEVSGDRIVIGKGSAVTAAVHARDCEIV